MAIQEENIQGLNCTLYLETDTFDGTIVNWEEVRWALERRADDFSPASSGIVRYTTNKKSIPAITVRITRGLGQTFKDLKNLFDDQVVNLLTMTDFIANQTEFDAYVAEYGTLGVLNVAAVQGGGPGMVDVTVRFGLMESGYSPV